MSKVIKSFSLELRTVEILERYCAASDSWDKQISRSKVVNDALVWFLSGDVAELVHNNEQLVKKFGDVMREKDSPKPRKSWWRHILGL
tara:strand:- start:170 stop:433 length:264 start_codon:yes stop_codon:yes gene_type:complete